ncbi:hypothetical protein JYT91_01325, partial [archaeon AH-315-M20]|nr:hypothetical protein [archaeon AH-315-M20]
VFIVLNLILMSSVVYAPGHPHDPDLDPFTGDPKPGRSCFLPGTLITMGDGSKKPIEDVQIGEKILSYDENTKELVVSEVLGTESPIRSGYMIMTFENGVKLNLTKDHPMYAKIENYEGWASMHPEKTYEDYGVLAEEFNVGDYILNVSKEWVQIIDLQYVDESVTTYDLWYIANTRTYFADGFLAHNREHPPSGPVCGDNQCNGAETCSSCQQDCGLCACSVKQSGCYNTDGNRVSSGSLAIDQLEYYYSKNVCIAGDCACPGSSTDETTATVGADSSPDVCSCVAGTNYLPETGCCGDTRNDCGVQVEGVLCSMNANFLSADWKPSSLSYKDIVYVGCSNAEYVSDGLEWVPCLNNFFIRNIAAHDYLCIGQNIVETQDTTTRISINSDTFNYNLAQALNNPTNPVDVVVTISPEVKIGSEDVNEPSFTTGILPQGSTVKIINKGKIQGKGGDGGYAHACGSGTSKPGQDGGTALEITLPIILDNSEGEILGGGGGGGGGGDGCDKGRCGGTGGGGGGAGYLPGKGGGAHADCPAQGGNTNRPGGDGTETSGGSGGGAGGGPGKSGQAGQTWRGTYTTAGGAGGKAGASIQTNGFEITYVTGDVIEIVDGIGRESLIECCGSGICNSDGTDGKRLSTGESIEVNTITNYCTTSAVFTPDLDTYDVENCETAKNPDGTDANFIWTGNLCCSEDDDPVEYYNDPGENNGACWNKQAISPLSTVPDREDILNVDGVFYGCAINENDDILTYKDNHTNEILIDNTGYCFQPDENNIFFCEVDNTWQRSDGIDISHFSQVPESFDVQQTSGCCQPNKCWDGTTCTENQANDPNSNAVNGFRCIDGEWESSTLISTPTGDDEGYCPDNSQCLVNIFGNANENNMPDNNPQCIADTQYIDDDYCEDGDWTSRTKFLALQLLDIVENEDNYVIFCDNAQDAVNNLNYAIGEQSAANLVAPENTNNFCILVFNNKIIFGTSLNYNLSEDNTFLQAIDIESCNIINDNIYHPCSNQDVAWYNDRLQSIIYSNQTFQIGQPNIFDTFINFLQNPFETIKNIISNIIEEPTDTSYIDGLKKFERLYISKTGSKIIRGTIEGRVFQNLVIEYQNFDTDICSFTNEFNEKKDPLISGIACSKENPSCTTSCTYYVLAQGSEFLKLDPDAIWTDLTSKLRVG